MLEAERHASHDQTPTVSSRVEITSNAN